MTIFYSCTTKACDGTCPCPCTCDGVVPSPVCGVDGKEYVSECEAKCKYVNLLIVNNSVNLFMNEFFVYILYQHK